MANSKLLGNIRKLEQVLQLYTNTGMTRVTWEGNLSGVVVSWWYKDDIVNGVPQAKAVRENNFEIDYSTRTNMNGLHDFKYHVETKKGKKLQFVLNKKGLHVLD